MSQKEWNGRERLFPAVLLSNAAVAFALNMSVYLLIGKTSALTMNVAGVIKDWILIFISSLIFDAPISNTQLGGYLLAFLAVCYYNYAKFKEKEAAAAMGRVVHLCTRSFVRSFVRFSRLNLNWYRKAWLRGIHALHARSVGRTSAARGAFLRQCRLECGIEVASYDCAG